MVDSNWSCSDWFLYGSEKDYLSSGRNPDFDYYCWFINYELSKLEADGLCQLIHLDSYSDSHFDI